MCDRRAACEFKVQWSLITGKGVFGFCFLRNPGLLPGGRPEEGVRQQLCGRGSVVRVRLETVHDEAFGLVRHALRNLGVDLKHADLDRNV